MLAILQEFFAVWKKASVVYNFLTIWLVYGISTIVWTLIHHSAPTNQNETAELW